MNEIERRWLTAELRAADDAPRRLEGYAAIFNSASGDLGGFREMIAPGAFRRTLAENADVRALWNHEAMYVLGRTTTGTLRLSETAQGLWMAVDLPETQYASDLLALVRRGDVSQMSFAFRKIVDEWQRGDDLPLRRLLDVDLFDVSPVTFPAYEATNVVVATRDIPAWVRGGTAQAARDVAGRLDVLRKRVDVMNSEIGG